MKNVHSQIMMIHIYYKFHEMTIIGYLVMSQFTAFQSIKGR